jgi:hypothetical protein
MYHLHAVQHACLITAHVPALLIVWPQICALGLLSLLSLPEDSLPAEVRASGHLLLAGLLRLLTALKEQQAEAERLAKEAEEEEEEEEEDEGDGADLEDVDDDEVRE